MPNRPILVIDDDPRFCELVTGILTHADFEVFSAHDGWTGIELAHSVQPVLILLDMVMPGLNGITTCQRLKRDLVLRDVPVVGMTSSDDLKFTEKAFHAGAELFLPKPFQAASLVRTVELALSLAQRDASVHRRRRHPRLEASVHTRCLVGEQVASLREVMGRTANVSLGGLMLSLPEMLMSGTLLRLGLNLPEGIITAHGAVMWISPQPKGNQSCRHGVRLLGFMQDNGLIRYRHFLSQVAAGQGTQVYPAPQTMRPRES
jgi:DNA-binding response OmpR family regulator